MRERIVQYALLMRVHKPIGSLLLLWPTLWALWIAGAGEPDARIVLVFVAGVFVMRSAGCVINDYADRRIDPHVRRTKDRPIASGRVKPGEALVLFAVLCLVGLGLVLTLNGLTVLLSFAAAALAASYPFMKRWTHLPQIHLGVAFGVGDPDGVRRAHRRDAAARVAAVRGSRGLDPGLRHDVRDGRPRG